MFVIVLFGLMIAVLAAIAVFILVFIEVAAAGPGGLPTTGTGRRFEAATRVQHGSLPQEAPVVTADTGTSSGTFSNAAETSVVRRQVEDIRDSLHDYRASAFRMNAAVLFSRDARHLRILAVLIVAAGAGALFVRSQIVPPAFGERGPYRAAALEENAAFPSVLQADAKCLSCHAEVQEERAESPHQAVLCMHCHGNGRQHMADAALAAEDPDHAIPPAEEWDGDFLTKADLFITHDRATCLSCHMSVVGMPSNFRSINVAEHLEEQGAEDIESSSVCFECHTGHSPGF
ncbi:MAG: hypothetical protein R3C19_13535 [Planctomycetaceae bacterium]